MNKDFSIEFLDYFLKKFKIIKKTSEFKNKFIFPLDNFFFLFFRTIFSYLFLKNKKLKSNLIFDFLIKRFFLKISKLKYNSRDL